VKKILYAYALFFAVSIGLTVADQALYMYSKYARAKLMLKYYDSRVAKLEARQLLADARHEELIARHVELQKWREAVTVASRMGWRQAHMYMREYPLEHHIEGFEERMEALP
jgi:hypothetical protein